MPSLNWCFLTAQYLVEHALSLVGWVGTFFAGYWTARHLQDRDVKQRQRAVASALLEEVRRIRLEIGAPVEDDLTAAFGLGALVPEVHPWVQGIIADAARSDPAIVGAFMRLEARLHNLRVIRGTHERHLDRAQTAAAVAEAELKREDPEAETREVTEEDFERFTQIKQNVTVSENTLRNSTAALKISYKQVHSQLDDLEVLLTKAAG